MFNLLVSLTILVLSCCVLDQEEDGVATLAQAADGEQEIDYAAGDEIDADPEHEHEQEHEQASHDLDTSMNYSPPDDQHHEQQVSSEKLNMHLPFL